MDRYRNWRFNVRLSKMLTRIETKMNGLKTSLVKN
jgi:hypothetical protein